LDKKCDENMWDIGDSIFYVPELKTYVNQYLKKYVYSTKKVRPLPLRKNVRV